MKFGQLIHLTAFLVSSCVSPGLSLVRSNLDLPDTKPAHLIREYLGVCSDQQKLVTWLQRNLNDQLLQLRPAEAQAEELSKYCRENGGFEIEFVLQSEAEVIRVLTLGQVSQVWTRFALACDANGRVSRISPVPTFTPRSALPPDLNDSIIAGELKATVQRLAEADLFSGIAVLARGSQIIATASAGFADKEARIPITLSSHFTLASMNKMFTSVAIGQLVEQKKLSYNDPVGKFFPRFANRAVREKATVGMLLSHKAGLGDFLDKRTPEIMRKGTATASDLLTFFENDEPSFEPGTSFQYSNNGLILAGAIVELVSGEPYYDYVRRHIFKPLGMSDTDPNNRRHQDPLLVTPYTHFTETAMVKDWIIADADLGTPAGGAISSAEDLLRFADGLRRGKLVSLDTLMEITKSREIRPIIGDYGYAFDINEVHGRKVIGHGGEFLGVSTLLAMIQDTPYNIVVLSNQDPDAALRVSGHLVSMAAAASWKSGN